MPKKRPGKYPGSMQSVPLKIPNTPRDAFRGELQNVPFLGYDVEQLKDGRLGANPTEAKRVVLALNRVHIGEDPDAVLASREMTGLGAGLPGEPPDLILKAYKWIFGQEDCNYPTSEGRDMAMDGILELVSKGAK